MLSGGNLLTDTYHCGNCFSISSRRGVLHCACTTHRTRLHRACRKTTLSVTGASWPPSFLSTVAVLSVLPTPMPCLLTCRPVPGPASVCADCRRGETGDLPSPASATDVPWAC